MTQFELHLAWPWEDRRRKFSLLKAAVFALMFSPGLWLIYQVGAGEFGGSPLAGMTYWSGVWATALLLLALAVTPARVIFRWNELIVVRRMIGVSALVYTIAHIIIYFALRFWDFSFIATEMVTRLTLIVATVSTVGLIALGVTSLDAAIRWMGVFSWNRLHTLVYVFTGLAVLHYLLSPGLFASQYLISGMFFWLMVWRLLDRRRRGSEPRSLAMLAVASGVFTALLEVGWIWAYHGYEPLWTLGNNFTLTFGISPAWKILAIGLVVSLAAAMREKLESRGQAESSG